MPDLNAIFRNTLPNPGYCLVIRPFGEEFDRVWGTIREEFAKTFYWRDVADLNRSGEIMEEVLTAIAGADVVIVDVTANNPNVFYELGIAHKAKGERKVILVRQRASGRGKRAKVPFDIAGVRYLEYEPTPGGIDALRLELEVRIRTALEKTSWFRLAEGSTYTSDALSGPDRAYRFEVRALSFLDRSVGGGDRSVRYGSVDIEIAVRPHPHDDGSEPDVVRTTLSAGATCKIPNLKWCLKFEHFERDREREDEAAVICVIPAARATGV